MEEIELLEGFEDLSVFLIGNPKQFIVFQGSIYCIRKECGECPHSESCKFEEEKIQIQAIEVPRLGIAFEKRPFLVLLLKEGLNFCVDVPKELWDSGYSNFALDERNAHYVLADQKSKFRVLKGQYRFYGSEVEFGASEYTKYFDIFNQYTPIHYMMAMDLSAIEPRVSTIASREPEWIKVFQGISKVVAKEIDLGEIEGESNPS